MSSFLWLTNISYEEVGYAQEKTGNAIPVL